MPYADYQGLETEDLTVNFDIENQGSVESEEDVQLEVVNWNVPEETKGGTVSNATDANGTVDSLERTVAAGGTAAGETLTWNVSSGEGEGYYKATVNSGDDAGSFDLIAEVCVDDGLFAFGGYNGSDYLKEVSRYDGSSWETDSLDDLNTKVRSATAEVYEGDLYVFGGDTPDSGLTPDVQRYDGSSWETNPNGGLNTAVKYAASTVHNGNLYVLGGDDGSATALVQRFDGSSWEDDPHGGLNVPTRRHAAVEYNDTIWVLGGDKGITVRSQVQRLDGSSWEDDPRGGLNDTIRSHSAVVYDGDIYVLGGLTDIGEGNTKKVQRLEGSSWNTNPADGVNSLDTAVRSHVSGVYKDELYVVGGRDSDGATDLVQRWDESSSSWETSENNSSLNDGFSTNRFASGFGI